jgi:hypothetical protein
MEIYTERSMTAPETLCAASETNMAVRPLLLHFAVAPR